MADLRQMTIEVLHKALDKLATFYDEAGEALAGGPGFARAEGDARTARTAPVPHPASPPRIVCKPLRSRRLRGTASVRLRLGESDTPSSERSVGQRTPASELQEWRKREARQIPKSKATPGVLSAS